MTTTALDQKLLSRLLESPLALEIQAKDAAAKQAERASRVAAIAALEKSAAERLPTLKGGVSLCEKRLAAARQAVKVAEANFNRAFAEHQSLAVGTTADIERHRHALELSAPPEIDSFILDLDREAQRLRHLEPTVEHDLGRGTVRSNRTGILKRLAAATVARVTAVELKHQVWEPGELRIRLLDIWHDLPEIGGPK